MNIIEIFMFGFLKKLYFCRLAGFLAKLFAFVCFVFQGFASIPYVLAAIL